MDAVEDTIRDEIHADFDYVQNLLSDPKLCTNSRKKSDAVRASVFLLHQSCSFAVTDILEQLLSKLDKINKLDYDELDYDYRSQILYDCIGIAQQKKHENVFRILVEFAASKPEYFTSRIRRPDHRSVLVLEGLPFLQDAASKGDVELITMLITAGVNVNQTNEMGETALHFAKNATTAALLITNGADVNAMNMNNETPLYYACASCRLGVIRTLLDNGAKPNIGSSFIPLHVACEWNNDRSIAGAILQTCRTNGSVHDRRIPASCFYFYEFWRLNDDSRAHYCNSCKYENHFLREGIKAKATEIENDENVHEHSTLRSAVRNFHYSKVTGNNFMNLKEIKHLLSGSDSSIVSAIDSSGSTALYCAVENNLFEVATLLLDSGADPNLTTCGKYPLFVACKFLSHEFVELLLTRGADPNVIDNDNYDITPLFVAVESPDFRLVKLLVEHGADVNHRNKEGRTALDLLPDKNSRFQCLSSDSARIQTAKYLLDNGFNRNLMTTNTHSVFYSVCAMTRHCGGFHFRLFELLLDFFCDAPNMRFYPGAEIYSIRFPFRIRDYLRHGGDPNHRDRSGRNLLSLAFAQANVHCARILLAAGADPTLVTWDSIVLASLDDNISVIDAILASGVKFNVINRKSMYRWKPPEVITLSEFYVPLCTETECIVRLFKAGSSLSILMNWCRARRVSTYRRTTTCLKAGRLCQAVVLAGHKVQQQQLAVQLRESERPEARDLASWLDGEWMTPPTLFRLSRTAIRRQLSVASGCRTILPLIDVLPITNLLRLYLKFEGPKSEINLSLGSDTCAGCRSNTDYY